MSQIAKLNGGPGSIKLARSREPIVKANELLFVHFERPDIGKAERYLLDFGLTVVAKSEGELFMRGTGSQPYIYRISIGPEARFLGLGLSVPTKEEAPSSICAIPKAWPSTSCMASCRTSRCRFARQSPITRRTKSFE
jgi:hypothetical protein